MSDAERKSIDKTLNRLIYNANDLTNKYMLMIINSEGTDNPYKTINEEDNILKRIRDIISLINDYEGLIR